MHERYPHFKRRLLIAQASMFALPFGKGTFDYVYSLGVLMHTGNTLKAVAKACEQVKDGGEINIWLYCSAPLAYDATESTRRDVLTLANVSSFMKRLRYPMFWIHLFRKLGHSNSLRIVKLFSSDSIYKLSKKRGFGWIGTVFPGVDHPDQSYRLITNYDGYINNWSDTWSEHEIFPVLKSNSMVILGMSERRLGLWVKKLPGFYPQTGEKESA